MCKSQFSVTNWNLLQFSIYNWGGQTVYIKSYNFASFSTCPPKVFLAGQSYLANKKVGIIFPKYFYLWSV